MWSGWFWFASPKANDVENLLTCLLAIKISFLKKCLQKSSGHFSIESFVFLVELQVFFIYSGYKSLTNIWFANIFPYSVGSLSTFFMVFFEANKFLIFMKSKIHVSFSHLSFGVIPKMALPHLNHKGLLMF